MLGLFCDLLDYRKFTWNMCLSLLRKQQNWQQNIW